MSLFEILLVDGEPSDTLLVDLDVLDQVRDLSSLEVDLLVKVNLLLSDDVELLDLLVDDLLSLLQG